MDHGIARAYPAAWGRRTVLRRSISILVVEIGSETSEVDWRNLCPESRAELGDAMTMIDFIGLQSSDELTLQLNNQYTLVGYDIPGFSVPNDEGCYIIYDSFGAPECTVTLVTTDCESEGSTRKSLSISGFKAFSNHRDSRSAHAGNRRRL